MVKEKVLEIEFFKFCFKRFWVKLLILKKIGRKLVWRESSDSLIRIDLVLEMFELLVFELILSLFLVKKVVR